MEEFLAQCLTTVNLPYSVLLIITLVYWATVFLGILDMHSLDADVSADVAVDGDVHVGDLHGADVHGVDVHGGDVHTGDVHGDVHGHVDADGAHGHPGVASEIFKFFHIGEVPLMIVISIAVLCMWTGSMLGNHYINPNHNLLIAGGMFVPNLLLGLFVSKLVTTPLKPLFRVISSEEGQAAENLVGKRCIVRSEEVTSSYGQAEVETDAAPNVINVRAGRRGPLGKGDEAVILEYDPEKNTYIVGRIDWEA